MSDLSKSRAETSIPWTEYGLLLVLASVWGASYTFIKIGIETIPPVTLIAARTLIAGAVLLAVLACRGRPHAEGGGRLEAVCVSGADEQRRAVHADRVGGAQHRCGAAAILNSTTPIFTFVITVGADAPRAGRLAQACRHRPRDRRHLARDRSRGAKGIGIGLVAQLAVVLATICYAVAAIFGRTSRASTRWCRRRARSLPEPRCCCRSALRSTGPGPCRRPWPRPGLLGLAVVSTALAFTIYFRLLRTLGSIGATAQAYLRVPIGVGIGVLALGETVASTAAAGLVCVVVGVAAMTIPERKRLAIRPA